MTTPSLTEAEESLLADDTWTFIQDMAVRGYAYMVIRAYPGPPHVSFGKSLLGQASNVLRDCAEVVDAEAKRNASKAN